MINRNIQQSADPVMPSWHSSDARKINFVGAINAFLLMGLLAAAGAAYAGLGAQVTGEPSCADKKVVFDGIAPLRYATVVGEQGSRIFLHPQYPERCGSKDTTCDGKSYLVPGDHVAIGKRCGINLRKRFDLNLTEQYQWLNLNPLRGYPISSCCATGRFYLSSL